MSPQIEALFVAANGSEPMRRVTQVDAVAGCGIRGDRYCEGTGFYTPYDVCQVTLIEAEALEEMTERYGVSVSDGEHRRNIVTRGLRLTDLRGRELRIGEVGLVYDRPRPPCGYIQRLTGQKKLTKALGGGFGEPRGGVCVDVLTNGPIRVGDAIEVLGELAPPLRTLP